MSTLDSLITIWRYALDDPIDGADDTDNLWKNDELTAYATKIANHFCRQAKVIEDKNTADICTINIVADDTELAISDRITFITRAKITAQTNPLMLVSTEWMDAKKTDWENASAGPPELLINEGVGTDLVRIYPKADTTYTLTMTVYRMLLADLEYDTDKSEEFPIPAKYHDLLENGVLWLAYSKQDTDTLDLRKRTDHYRWHLEDLEELKRTAGKFYHRDEILQPHLGAL